jgi:hypothetical protein
VPFAEAFVPFAEALVVLTETVVHTRKVTMKAAKSGAVKPAKSTAVKSAAPAVEASAPAVEASAAAMRPGISGIWLAQHGSAQQSSCEGCQRPSYPRPGFNFAWLLHRLLHSDRPPITLLWQLIGPLKLPCVDQQTK